MSRVAIYARVSTGDQTTENQLAELRRWAERAGHDVVKVFDDRGVSGSKGRDKRPAFDAMLKDREFLAEIEKSGQEFYPAPGEQVQKLIAETANAPRNVVDLTEATLRYLQRWTTRATPFGRFAGVAPVA